MRQHCDIGQQILLSTGLAGAEAAALVIRHHHEHFDGGGYPDRLAADGIPIAARIIAIADSYDAMAVTRAYHAARGHGEILAIMRAESGVKHDPQLLQQFFAIIEDSPLKAADATGVLPLDRVTTCVCVQPGTARCVRSQDSNIVITVAACQFTRSAPQLSQCACRLAIKKPRFAARLFLRRSSNRLLHLDLFRTQRFLLRQRQGQDAVFQLGDRAFVVHFDCESEAAGKFLHRAFGKDHSLALLAFAVLVFDFALDFGFQRHLFSVDRNLDVFLDDAGQFSFNDVGCFALGDVDARRDAAPAALPGAGLKRSSTMLSNRRSKEPLPGSAVQGKWQGKTVAVA